MKMRRNSPVNFDSFVLSQLDTECTDYVLILFMGNQISVALCNMQEQPADWLRRVALYLHGKLA
jgi:hypothetical protein